jgi:hypothetical protein
VGMVGLAAAQVAGEDHVVGLDRQCADAAAQALMPVPGLCSTTEGGWPGGSARRSELGWRPGWPW